MKKLFASALVAFTLFSCKDKEANVEPAAEAPKEVSKEFTVTLDVKVKKDDSFHVYYSEDGTDNFVEENSVWAEFKATPDTNQQIAFKLPDGVFPTQLRIDFGANNQQEDIQLNGLTMGYAGKSFDIPVGQFLTYFTPNPENAKYDQVTGVITPLKKGQTPYFGPSFYPKPTIQQKIAELAK